MSIQKSANATVTVHKYELKTYDESIEGQSLKKIYIEESFSGDIEGDCVGEALQAVSTDGSASLVAIQRVIGKVGLKKGSFLLQVAGTVKGTTVSCDWFVIPRSGTGELAALRGEGGFHGSVGEASRAHLDYWFE